ncbi:unnamed protein product, partial [Symbiodinium natans]
FSTFLVGAARAGKPPSIMDEVLLGLPTSVRYLSRAGLKPSALDHISSGFSMLPRSHMRSGFMSFVEGESRLDCSLSVGTDVNVRQTSSVRQVA